MPQPTSLLITGAYSGLGREVLRLAFQAGFDVTSLVRTPAQASELTETYPGIRCLPCDLGCAEAVSATLHELKSSYFAHVLFCAGTGQVGAFEALAPETLHTTLQVNLLSIMQMVHGLLQPDAMCPGKITLVSSLMATLPAGQAVTYAVSKAGLSHFYRSLKQAQPALPLLCLEIGAVNTPMHAKAGNTVSRRGFKSPQKMGQKIFAAMLRQHGLRTLSPEWALLRLLQRLRP
ncbi:MAG: SDR family NAD(P)-dependent oxidoreductase [Candidatus Sericytochromatia bacterium]|nr:SDR family NAD(P)-dependent oxidoreductase [Candidatus Sericytochromatia bacterium]